MTRSRLSWKTVAVVVTMLWLAGSCDGGGDVIPPPSTSGHTPVTYPSGALVASASPQTPTPSPPTTTSSTVGATKSAPLRALAGLAVKGRAPKTGYSRKQFGTAWYDQDGNGCDTRNDILARDFVRPVFSGSCRVIGGLWTDPYSGVTYTFDHRPSELDGDHVVALSDAWQKGAQSWSAARRRAFANDPLNVVMTTATLNRQKGDSDAASWLPPDKRYRCAYVARQVAIKRKYQLWVTRAEHAAMYRLLRSPACAKTKLPSGSVRAR